MNDPQTTELTTTGGPLRKIEPTPEATTGQLIQFAIQAGQTPTELYAILREERQDARRMAFNRAKAKFQAECPPVPKSSVNKQFAKVVNKDGVTEGGRFAPLDTMQAVAHEHLVANGFAPDFDSDLEYETAHPDYVAGVFVLRHEAGHEERYTVIMPIPKPIVSRQGNQVQNECQCRGVALEYARRQAYRMGTGIRLVGEDTDGNVPEEPDEAITEQEARDLSDAILSGGADAKKFCERFKVTKLPDLSRSQLDTAWAELRKYYPSTKARP